MFLSVFSIEKERKVTKIVLFEKNHGCSSSSKALMVSI